MTLPPARCYSSTSKMDGNANLCASSRASSSSSPGSTIASCMSTRFRWCGESLNTADKVSTAKGNVPLAHPLPQVAPVVKRRRSDGITAPPVALPPQRRLARRGTKGSYTKNAKVPRSAEFRSAHLLPLKTGATKDSQLEPPNHIKTPERIIRHPGVPAEAGTTNTPQLDPTSTRS